jgi:hypothetical protein
MHMTGKGGRRHKQLLYDLKEKRGYWKLRQEALDRTEWRNSFVLVMDLSLRQTKE